MGNYRICGKRRIDGEVYDLYANTLTGDVVMSSDLLDNCLLSELSVMSPLTLDNESIYLKAMQAFNADGIIYSEKEIIVLKGYTAEYRGYDDMDKVIATVEFDDSIVVDDLTVE